MSDSDRSAVLEDEDGVTLEKENRELQTQQVRRINDTLRKVRRISRESQKMLRPVFDAVEIIADTRPTEPAPAPTLRVVEEYTPRTIDARRERDDSTDKILIPEPSMESPINELFRKAVDMFQMECAQFRFTKGKNSPVVRTWKLA